MIKIVQVEERRVICDICNKNYYTMHGLSDTKRDGWIHSDNFANSGKNLDICPTCCDFLKNSLDDFYTKSLGDKKEDNING